MTDSTNINTVNKYPNQDYLEEINIIDEQNLNDETIISKENKEDWFKISKSTVEGNTVFDIAAFILKVKGEMSTMKLQKLIYYCQVWSLVWDDKPLFNENIEAWENGPVVRKLFYFHRGKYLINNIEIGNPNILNKTQIETITSVLNFYGEKTSQWLIELSHNEKPWKDAIIKQDKIITHEMMYDYYSSL